MDHPVGFSYITTIILNAYPLKGQHLEYASKLRADIRGLKASYFDFMGS